MAVNASDLAEELESAILQLTEANVIELQPPINELNKVQRVMEEGIPDALVADYRTRILSQAGIIGRLATRLKNKKLETLSRQVTDIAVRLSARVEV